jgi:hypothetical protein
LEGITERGDDCGKDGDETGEIRGPAVLETLACRNGEATRRVRLPAQSS